MAAEVKTPGTIVLPKDTIKDEIQTLIDEQKKVRDERKRVSGELKNAQRRQKRLKHRARLLSSEDLLRALALRAQEEEAKAGKSSSEVAAPGASR